MSPLPRGSTALRERIGAARTAAEIPGWLNRPIDRDLTQFKINDHFITEELHRAITGGEIIENMAGAVAVSMDIDDASRNLIHRGILSKWVKLTPTVTKRDQHRRQIQVNQPQWTDIFATLDGRDLALGGVQKNGNTFSLTWENRAVAELRRYKSHKVWPRSQFTRAEAIKSMLDEVKGYHIPMYCPELHKIQPIVSSAQQPTKTQNTTMMQGGFSPNAQVRVKGVLASTQQKSYEARVIRTGISLKSPYIVLVSAIMTITQESDVHIDTAPNARGLFDQNPAYGWPATGTDIEKDATAYYTKAIVSYKSNPGQTPGEIAQSVQRSAFPSAYDQWETEAKATLALYGIPDTTSPGAVPGQTSTGGTTPSATDPNSYAFTRGTNGQPEDSFTCIERLASEVNWHAFMLDNTFYYVEDEQMMMQAPYDDISEDDAGIDEINYSVDVGRAVSEVSVLCHVDRWQTPPGALIVIQDDGPVEGRWLVYETHWPLFGNQVEVTLHLPTPPKPEPAGTASTTSSSGGTTVGGATGTGPIWKVTASSEASAPSGGPFRCASSLSSAEHGYTVMSLSGDMSDTGTFGQALDKSAGTPWDCGNKINVYNPITKKWANDVPHIDDGAGDSSQPVVGLMPGTRGDIGIDNGDPGTWNGTVYIQASAGSKPITNPVSRATRVSIASSPSSSVPGGSQGRSGIVTWSGHGSYSQAPIQMCAWIADELNWAIDHGWRPSYPVTSGYRPGTDPNTSSGVSNHQGTSYNNGVTPCGAIDFGSYSSPAGYASKKALIDLANRLGYPGPRLEMPIGFHDDGHCSCNGH